MIEEQSGRRQASVRPGDDHYTDNIEVYYIMRANGFHVCDASHALRTAGKMTDIFYAKIHHR